MLLALLNQQFWLLTEAHFYEKAVKNLTASSAGAVRLAAVIISPRWPGFRISFLFPPISVLPVKMTCAQEQDVCVSAYWGLGRKLSVCRRRRRAHAAVGFSCSQLSRLRSSRPQCEFV